MLIVMKSGHEEGRQPRASVALQQNTGCHHQLSKVRIPSVLWGVPYRPLLPWTATELPSQMASIAVSAQLCC